MNFRSTAVLAFVAACLALFLAFWGRDDDAIRGHDQIRRAFRFDPARVERLQVETPDLLVECVREGAQWKLVRPIAARANPVAVERLLGALQELPRGDLVILPRRSPHPYAPYGLDEPRARIEIVEGAATNRIHVGRRTPLGDGVYVRQPDRPGLLRIRAEVLDLLPASVEALRDRSLLAGSPAAIDRLDVRGPSGYIQLVRDADGSWRLFQPFTARADSASVVAIVEQILACNVVQFVQDGVRDLAPYGLDNHGAVTALLNSPASQGSQLLALGDPLPNAPHLVYARLQAESSVYAVPLAVRQALLVRPDDLRDRRIPGLVPEAIRSVRVEDGDSSLELVRDPDGAWNLAAPFVAPANSAAVDSLLRSWSNVRLVSFESTPPADPPPFSRRILVELRAPRALPVELLLGPHPSDPSLSRVSISGDSTVAAASPPLLLQFPLDPLPYRSPDVLSVVPSDVLSIQSSSGARSLQASRDPATGAWTADAAWANALLAALAPLRADALLSLSPDPRSFDSPFLSVSLRMKGDTAIAASLLVGDEISPGGPRRAIVRGRNLLFALSPESLKPLLPPEPAKPE